MLCPPGGRALANQFSIHHDPLGLPRALHIHIRQHPAVAVSRILRKPNWKQRGDVTRRYMGLGKAAREVVRWFDAPLRAFGYKLSPVARRPCFSQIARYGPSWME